MVVHDFMVRIFVRLIKYKAEYEDADVEEEIAKLPEEYREPVRQEIESIE